MSARTACLIIAPLTFLLAAPGSAQAEIASGLSAKFTLTSDYRFRGISQNNRSFAPQAEIDWTGEDGWSAGAWASTVNFNNGEDASFELDLYAGKEFDLDGTDLAVTLYYYSYPDHNPPPGGVTYSTLEADAVATHSFGSISLTATVAWSPSFFAGAGESLAVSAGAIYKINEWLSASANAGHQWAAVLDRTAGSGFPYAYWDAGLTATHGNVTLDLRFTGTNLSPVECQASEGGRNWCAAGFVATLGYSL